MIAEDMNDFWAYDGKRYRRHKFSPEIQQEIRKLNKLDNWHAPLGYLRDVLLIAASVLACLHLSWWFYPLAVVIIGSRQRAFSNLLHESAHEMLARSKHLNLLLGTLLTAYPIFQGHYAYKKAHVATHHPKLGDPQTDPDLVYFIEQGVYEGHSRRRLWLRLVIFPALGSKVVSHFWFLTKERILSLLRKDDQSKEELSGFWRARMRRDSIALVLFWVVVVALAAVTGNLVNLVLLWLVPYITAFQIIGWYIELSEHTPMIRFHNVDIHMTRNRRSRGLEAFLTGTYADHYHLDHHLDTRTPFWNLSRAHRVRLADPAYAAVNNEFGGLFTCGPDKQPSALVSIVDELAAMGERADVERGDPLQSV